MYIDRESVQFLYFMDNIIRMFDGEFNETQSERELKRLHLELLANRLDLSSESSF